jgi:hypothetical protein
LIIIGRAGQNIKGVSTACGEAFYTFICANISLNWILCIALVLTVGYLHRINTAPTPTALLAVVSFVYAVFSIAAVIIVAVSMSNPNCTRAISNVSWGQPLLGIAGYLNVAIDIVVMLVSGGVACMYHSPKQHIIMPAPYYQRVPTAPSLGPAPSPAPSPAASALKPSASRPPPGAEGLSSFEALAAQQVGPPAGSLARSNA